MLLLPPFGHCFVSGSVSLARVTPQFLAVTGFQVQFGILHINGKMGG